MKKNKKALYIVECSEIIHKKIDAIIIKWIKVLSEKKSIREPPLSGKF